MINWLISNWESVLSVLSAIFATVVWKRQRKIEDKLSRSTTAYNIILQKEFSFYEQVDAIFAELIPCVHDVIDNLTNDPHPIEFELSKRIEDAQKYFLIFMEKTMAFRNLHLRYEIYLPEKIRAANSAADNLMYSVTQTVNSEFMKLYNEDDEQIDKDKCREIKDSLLLSFATVRAFIISRLKELSEV